MHSRRNPKLFSGKPASSRREGEAHVTIPKDSIAGFLLLALAGGYYWLTRDIASSSLSDDVGADGLPKVLAALLAIVALSLTGKGLLAARRPAPVAGQKAEDEKDSDEQEQAALPRALGFMLIGVGYIVVTPFVGFAIGVALLIVTVAIYERERLSPKLIAVAAAGGLGFWLIFVLFLGTEQPTSSLLALFMKG
jgi:putative tricarboxylic transport membrane protein